MLATDSELRKTLARAYQQANLLPQAEPLLNQLLTEDLNDGECWRLFGLLLYQNGYYSTALRAFERSLAIGASAEAAAHRAVCLVQLGRFTEAEIAIREIEGRADAGNVDLLIARVQLLYETGRLEVALNAAESAVASRPGHPMTLYWRGTIRFRLGRLDQALRDAHASIAASPGLPFGRNLVVRIRRAQGRLADAAAEVEWLRQYEEAKTRRSGPELPQ